MLTMVSNEGPTGPFGAMGCLDHYWRTYRISAIGRAPVTNNGVDEQ
jgi:hypothetical protein